MLLDPHILQVGKRLKTILLLFSFLLIQLWCVCNFGVINHCFLSVVSSCFFLFFFFLWHFQKSVNGSPLPSKGYRLPLLGHINIVWHFSRVVYVDYLQVTCVTDEAVFPWLREGMINWMRQLKLSPSHLKAGGSFIKI